MPSTQFALGLEQRYGLAVGALWRRVLAIVARQYAGIDRDNLASAFRLFIPAASQVVSLGQQQAQIIASAFVQQYIEAETGRAFRTAPNADGIAGHARDGKPVASALSGATGAVWMALQSGKSTPEALSYGLALVSNVVTTSVQDAAEAEQSHQAERSRGVLKGWTWVTVGASCAACLALQDGEVNPYPARNRRHARCDCQSIPSILGVRDEVRRPTGEQMFLAMSPEQQAKVFKNAADEKAELIRSGQATLADFLTTRSSTGGKVITEAPLQAVA